MNNITTIEERCCACGTLFAMEEPLREIRLRDGGAFYCPNGHGQHFAESDKSKAKKAADELAELKEELRLVKEENTRLKCERLGQDVKPKKKLFPWS